MSDIACTACTITTEREAVLQIVYHRPTGATLTAPEGLRPEAFARLVAEGKWAELGVREEPTIVNLQAPKAFEGTLEEAQAAGWEEQEHGLVCPECVAVLADDPNYVHGAGTEPGLLVAAVLGEKPGA